MKIFFAAFFICLVLICGVLLLGALFGGPGLLLLSTLVAAALASVLVNTLKTQEKRLETLEKRISELEGGESEHGEP